MSDRGELDPAEVLRLANAAAAGRRPYFFDDRDVDRLRAIVWAMAGELAVTRERLDTVERLLEGRALLPRDEIERYRPDPAAASERGQWQIEYVARLLRILQQEADAMQRGAGEPTSEEVARELGERAAGVDPR
jgi:hypothetical protein